MSLPKWIHFYNHLYDQNTMKFSLPTGKALVAGCQLEGTLLHSQLVQFGKLRKLQDWRQERLKTALDTHLTKRKTIKITNITVRHSNKHSSQTFNKPMKFPACFGSFWSMTWEEMMSILDTFRKKLRKSLFCKQTQSINVLIFATTLLFKEARGCFVSLCRAVNFVS